MSTKESPWWRRLRAMGELAGDFQQKDIAHTVGVSEARVSQWKRGEPPSAENVIAAADAYGADPVELMRLVGILPGDRPTRSNTISAKAPRRKRSQENFEISPRTDREPL